jgi:hypothetical protein
MADPVIRRSDDMLFGRLVAMPSNQTMQQVLGALQNQGLQGSQIVSIDFPAMPDTLELARSADYAVQSNLVLPDGVHQYRGTKPLEIPVSFRLHGFDSQFCKMGALTLIQLAARLHAFILPISPFGANTVIAPKAVANQQPGKGKSTDPQQETDAQGNTVYAADLSASNAKSASGNISAPVTCWLHLMWVGDDRPGISCIGYVRDVKVVFGGPWMRGPNNSFNLPNWAEYSFTFVHRPGHGNAQFTASDTSSIEATTVQAFADNVKSKFYNTRDLATVGNYQGFTDNQIVPAASSQRDPDSAPPQQTFQRSFGPNQVFQIP